MLEASVKETIRNGKAMYEVSVTKQGRTYVEYVIEKSDTTNKLTEMVAEDYKG